MLWCFLAFGPSLVTAWTDCGLGPVGAGVCWRQLKEESSINNHILLLVFFLVFYLDVQSQPHYMLLSHIIQGWIFSISCHYRCVLGLWTWTVLPIKYCLLPFLFLCQWFHDKAAWENKKLSSHHVPVTTAHAELVSLSVLTFPSLLFRSLHQRKAYLQSSITVGQYVGRAHPVTLSWASTLHWFDLLLLLYLTVSFYLLFSGSFIMFSWKSCMVLHIALFVSASFILPPLPSTAYMQLHNAITLTSS